MTLVRHVRTASAAALACAAVVLAVGTWTMLLSREVRSALQPVPVAAAEPASATGSHVGDLDARVPAALVAPGGDGARSSGSRSAIAAEAEPAVEARHAQRAPAAGELEVLVRVADRPAEGWVALQRVAINDPTAPFDRLEMLESALQDGSARFRDVPRGLLLVGVHVGADPPQRALWVHSGARGARLEFQLGGSGIHGRIRAPAGAAVEGARIVVSGRHGTVVVSSAADGSYDAGEHFPAGRYTVAVDGFPGARTFPQRRVDLGAGATRDVSFGPGGDLSRWRGRVRTANGDWVREGDGLDERALRLVARSGRGVALDVDVVDGAIDQWFERDVYALRAASQAHERDRSALLGDARGAAWPSSDAVDLSRDLVRDVQLRGFVLRGRVEPPRAGHAYVALSGVRQASELRAAVDAEGLFRFVGLEPGDYELRWASDRAQTVAIDAHGPLEVELDLTRSPPMGSRSACDPRL